MKEDFVACCFALIICSTVAFFVGYAVGSPTRVEKNHIAGYAHLKEVCEARKTFIVAQQTIIDRLDTTSVQDDCYNYLKDKCELDNDD